MASVSSIISLVALLLAAYCSAVPIGTDYDHTTAAYEFATGKTMGARESMGYTEPEEYSTVHSLTHQRREHGAARKDGSESDEATTERSMINDVHHRRSLPVEATSMISERTVDDESERGDYTTERSMTKDGLQRRYTPVEVTSSSFEATSMISKRDHSESESDEKTTERSVSEERYPKRDSSDEVTSSPFEATSMISKREHSDEMTTERSMSEERYPKRDVSDEVTSSPWEATSMINERSADMEMFDVTTERSHAERELENDSVESSTSLNKADSHMGERETFDQDVTTDFESTSSSGSVEHASGDLSEREVTEATKGKPEMERPSTYYRKTETVIPGKVTKTELSSDGQNQSYSYKETAVDHDMPSFSEGTTEENDSKTNTDH